VAGCYYAASVGSRRRVRSGLAHQALHDALTGLPNRVLLADRLDQALAGAGRSRGGVAVVFIDLDRFKFVNDSRGHAAGDSLLVTVAERLRQAIRSQDTVARFGGDEFMVVCEDAAAGWEAGSVAERIADSFQAPFLVYRAKAEGRARLEFFDANMRTEAVERLEIESALHRAVERDELRVFYQPVINLSTGQVHGVEALLRWMHPTRGLLPPNRSAAGRPAGGQPAVDQVGVDDAPHARRVVVGHVLAALAQHEDALRQLAGQ
jgi:predicted signal transduction protein with EAL and GGDEF domain